MSYFLKIKSNLEAYLQHSLSKTVIPNLDVRTRGHEVDGMEVHVSY